MPAKIVRGRTNSAALNIRNFPRELLKNCKIRALQRDQPLRDFIIETLQNAVAVSKSRPHQRKQQ